MGHLTSTDDREFRHRFEQGEIAPGEFDHRAHVRLAYVYLAEHEPDAAFVRMRDALFGFLDHHGIGRAKYHETITRAWILAIRHFMERCPSSDSADGFIASDARMLDSKIMLTHYSAELLFSDRARAGFVEPDLDPIPRYPDRDG